MRIEEIRDLNEEEKLEKLEEFENELLRLRTLVRSGGAIENPGRIKEIRRNIARIKTALNE